MLLMTENNSHTSFNKPDQQGYALVMVVWVMAILTMLALGFSRTVTDGSTTLGNATQAIQARLLAQAALERGLHALFNPGQGESWKLDGTGYQFDYGGARLTFSLESEHGKIDVNAANTNLLRALFEDALLDQAMNEAGNMTPDRLVDRVMDWRDRDEFSRLEGAELPDYEALSYGGGPANRPFISIAELQQVLGMDRRTYEKIEPMITVHSYEGTLNPLYATPSVLKLIPGIVDEEVEDYIFAREQNDYANNNIQLPTFSGGNNILDQKTSSVYTITGRADLPSRLSYLIRIVVWNGQRRGGRTSGVNKTNDAILPYKILEVREDHQISSTGFIQDNPVVFIR